MNKFCQIAAKHISSDSTEPFSKMNIIEGIQTSFVQPSLFAKQYLNALIYYFVIVLRQVKQTLKITCVGYILVVCQVHIALLINDPACNPVLLCSFIFLFAVGNLRGDRAFGRFGSGVAGDAWVFGDFGETPRSAPRSCRERR